MKRLLVTLIVVSLLTSACSLIGIGDSQPAVSSAPVSEKRCGDGVCEGPENTSNCPEDCSEKHQPSTSTELPPLYVGFSVHLEGYELGNSQTGYNMELYEQYCQWILEYSDLANEFGMPFTWENANLIEPSGALEPNILLELYQRGDGVGVHADLGGSLSPGEVDKLTIGLRKLQLDMQSLGVPVSHVSGICSSADWVSAALEAGFEATSGVVDYCLKSLPLDQQTPEIQSCARPGDCHDQYPHEIPEMLHPWQAQEGSNWTTPAAEGLLIVPTAGEIKCLYEGATQPGSYTHCEVTMEDVDIALQVIAEALDARDPSQFNQIFFVWSFGKAIDHEILRSFFAGIKTHVDAGDMVWQTMPELIQTYQAQK